MESMLFHIALLFLLVLLVNAIFNLFCGLCVFYVASRETVKAMRANVPTGVQGTLEDSDGIRHIISGEELQRLRESDAEINRMVDAWTQT